MGRPMTGQDAHAAILVPGMSHGRRQRALPVRSRRARVAARCLALVVSWALLALLRGVSGGRPGCSGSPGAPAAPRPPSSWELASVPFGDHRNHSNHGDHEHHEHHEHASFRLDVGHLASHPALFFVEIVAVVVLSLLFEMWEHWVHRKIHHAGDKTAEKILAAIFKELTCLGFIGLFLFGATRCGLMETFTHFTIGSADEHVLLETFETVHMIIFFLLLVLIFQAVALLHVSHNVICNWGDWEHTKTYGIHRNSLESMFVKAGYLERVPNEKAPRGVDLVSTRRFTYGSSFFDRVRRRYDRLHTLVFWRYIRHEFLFPSDRELAVVPNPTFFSFSAYLRSRLSEVVLYGVELDTRVWFVTLLLPGPVMYGAIYLTYSGFQVLLLAFTWCLCGGAFLLTLALEEDLHELVSTDALPEDARQILLFFQGTSHTELMRQFSDDDEENVGIMLGAPGFRSVRKILSMRSAAKKRFFLSVWTYKELFRFVGFWQAVCVTVAITTYITRPPSCWTEMALCGLTFVEWPFMLFRVIPIFMRRLTIRCSCGEDADEDVIRMVTLDCKQAMLRHHLHLVQFEGLYDRAAKKGLAWALGQSDPRHHGWSPADAAALLRRGLHKFQSLPMSAQEEISDVFAIWDANNDGLVYVEDVQHWLGLLGFKEKAHRAAVSLVRMVDHDGAGSLSWEKFQAAVALATVDRPAVELREDLETCYDLIGKDASDKVHCHQIADWLKGAGMGTDFNDEDVASLLYEYFSKPKPTVIREEFVAWLQAIGSHWYSDGHGHSHGAH
mmetsp:Transcript_74835/g.206349  ORF Transcript_74835/g.206349 Transcript_74835/m.206349 type:complete len:784 (-) Transcript_74835:272-2623(-)